MTGLFKSLRFQLGLFLSVLVLLGWVIGAGFAVRTVSSSISGLSNVRLQQSAQQLLAAFDHELFDDHDDDEHDDDDHDRKTPTRIDRTAISKSIRAVGAMGNGLDYLILDAQGRVLFMSDTADLASFPVPPQLGLTQSNGRFFYFEQGHKGRVSVYAQESENARSLVIRQTFRDLLWPILILLPIMLLSIWAIVSRALRPIAQLQSDIEIRGQENLDPIARTRLPSEISGIHGSVNQLLERLRKTLVVERRFIAQAAHELRTPVAAALAQTERLIQEAQTPQASDRAENIRHSLDRLKRLCEKLLQLAKAEGGLGVTRSDIDLRDVLKLVVHEISVGNTVADQIQQTLPETPVHCAIDPDGFAILIRNLVENALLHGTPGLPITVRLDKNGGVQVDNDCDPVDPAVLSQLVDANPEPAPSLKGNGMGLMIVRKLADATGMTVTVSSPITGSDRGFSVSLRPK